MISKKPRPRPPWPRAVRAILAIPLSYPHRSRRKIERNEGQLCDVQNELESVRMMHTSCVVMTCAPSPEEDDSITALLAQLARGNRDAESRLIPQVYAELRRLAARYMQNERRNHTLQPTALVNEAYVRLVQQPEVAWQGRAHFFAVAAQVMRHVLVDHARARRAGKRGGAQHQITLTDGAMIQQSQPIDVIALHEAMERLAAIDARQSRIVELRFFGGLSIEEIAQILEVSERTVKRDWNMARAWLHGELTKHNDAG